MLINHCNGLLYTDIHTSCYNGVFCLFVCFFAFFFFISVAKQTASGTYRSCVLFKKNAVPLNDCFDATNIPNDALSTVFSISSFLGIHQSVVGTTCYCSNKLCNGATSQTPSFVNLMVVLVLCFAFIWSM